MVMKLDLANLQAEIVDTLQKVMGIEKISLFLFDKRVLCAEGIARTQRAAQPHAGHEQRTIYELPVGVQSADRQRRNSSNVPQDLTSDWPPHWLRP